MDAVHGLGIYGATATLFTLGRHNTVQQFDLNPPTLVANRQHIPPLPPPSPPVSNESRRGAAEAVPVTAVSMHPPATAPYMAQSLAPVQDDARDLATSPLRRIAEEMDQIEERRHERSAAGSTTSSNSRSVGASSSRSSNSRRYDRSNISAPSFNQPSEGTQFSHGSSFQAGRASVSTKQSAASHTSSQASGVPRGSRLRQEVLRSPDQPDKVIDLFPLARERLSDVPYQNPVASASANRTAADLRRQLLSVVFGWNGDVESLIEDERKQPILYPYPHSLAINTAVGLGQVPANVITAVRGHPPGSPGAVLLSKWLNNVSADMFQAMSASNGMSSSDWMLLALSSMGGQSSTKKVAQAFVQRLLEKDDIHAAVTILLGLGEHNDAVEVYFSHRLFM